MKSVDSSPLAVPCPRRPFQYGSDRRIEHPPFLKMGHSTESHHGAGRQCFLRLCTYVYKTAVLLFPANLARSFYFATVFCGRRRCRRRREGGRGRRQQPADGGGGRRRGKREQGAIKILHFAGRVREGRRFPVTAARRGKRGGGGHGITGGEEETAVATLIRRPETSLQFLCWMCKDVD